MINSGKMNPDLYYKIVFVRFKKYFSNTSEEEINEYFKLREKEKLFCEYCNVELFASTDYPYKQTVSLDRRLPEGQGGKNEFDNIAICCTQCNIVKGTLDAEEYTNFIRLLSADEFWSKRIIQGLFWGRKANMIRRKNKKEKEGRMLSDFT